MGCSICHTAPESHNSHGAALQPSFAHYAQDLQEGMAAQSSELKLKQSNYVMVTVTRLKDVYEVLEKIGEGGFGCVYRARHRSLGYERAIKSLELGRLPWQQQVQLLSEVNTLKEMDHPNILKVYEVIKDGDWYHIVTEMLSGGELLERVTEGGVYSETVVAAYMQQILSAVYYCHGKRIIHRDLKPENLVFESRAKDAVLKVIDFGTSCAYEDLKQGLVGTAYYIAPEILRSKKYDEKCDVWSCGVILYMLLSGFPPFNGDSESEIHSRILRDQVTFPVQEWEWISDSAKDLVRKMLTKDPKRRLSAKEALEHPWVQGKSGSVEDRLEQGRAVLTKLKEFKAGTKLRQAALHLITSQFTSSSEYAQLREVFMSLDTNKDGKLSREELIHGFTLLRLGSPADVDEIMQTCDVDQSGFIEFTEFLTATLNWKHVLDTDLLHAAFNTFDRNRDGKITANELKFVFEGGESVGGEVWESMLRESSVQTEGDIEFPEFQKMMVRKLSRKTSNKGS